MMRRIVLAVSLAGLGLAAVGAATPVSAQYRYYDGRSQCPPGYQHENYGCVPNVPMCPPGYGKTEYGTCEPERPRYNRYGPGYYDEGPRYYRPDGRAGSGECPAGYQHENRGCVPIRRW